VICNELFSAFFITPKKDRQSDNKGHSWIGDGRKDGACS
jgi:hypothetical protein